MLNFGMELLTWEEKEKEMEKATHLTVNDFLEIIVDTLGGIYNNIKALDLLSIGDPFIYSSIREDIRDKTRYLSSLFEEYCDFMYCDDIPGYRVYYYFEIMDGERIDITVHKDAIEDIRSFMNKNGYDPCMYGSLEDRNDILYMA